jgi:hypothetical protein
VWLKIGWPFKVNGLQSRAQPISGVSVSDLRKQREFVLLDVCRSHALSLFCLSILINEMKSMHQHYAIAFAGDSFGFALYHPRPASDLRPGACGYFNDKGVWETLFNLYATPGDPYAVPKNMYVAAGLGDEGSIVRHNFPEKVSHSMRRIEMAGEARIA